jgi:hypothetical protein
MSILDNTIMGELANSYIDQNYADTYFDQHFNALKTATWTALGDEQKQQLLVQACWDIEQFKYTETTTVEHSVVQGSLKWDSRQGRFTAYVTPSKAPVPYNVYQQLQFPRNRDIRADGTVFIPERMKFAQCEQAIYLVTLDETALSNRLQGLNLDRVVLGEIGLTQEYAYQGTTLAPLALEFIRPYLYKSKRTGRS